MRVLKQCLFLLPVLFLAACGTSSDIGVGTTDHDNPALQLPVRFSGVGVGPEYSSYSSLPRLRGSYLRYGTIQDGTGRIAEYLAHDAGADGHIRRFGVEPPVIRVAEGATPAMIRDTLWAVRTINAALPDSWKLRLASEPAVTNTLQPLDGEIVIEFQPSEEWPVRPLNPEARGFARRFNSPDGSEIVSGHIWMDVGPLGHRSNRVLFREILHTLGRNRLDGTRFPSTVMNEPPGLQTPFHVLHALDREALLAVYGRLGPGTTKDQLYERLGPWSEESKVLVGSFGVSCLYCGEGFGSVVFGVSARNGLVQPWTWGFPSTGPPYDNGSGVAFWAGDLAGFTPAHRPVVGTVSLELDIGTLHGELAFRSLESWTAEPGAVGTGYRWRDGDLDYTVAVREGTLVSIAGDDGVITGKFYGHHHGGVAGVLERDDLKAAFGAARTYP